MKKKDDGWLPKGGDKLSTKKVGTIGELSVQSEILNQGFNVYIPVCDDDQVDLVVETELGFKRVQVKTVTGLTRGTAVECRLKKYVNTNRVDVFALHYLPKGLTAFYPYHNEGSIILALYMSKNGQDKGRDWFYKYEKFPIITTKGT